MPRDRLPRLREHSHVRPVKLLIRTVLNRLGFEVVRTPALMLHHQLLRRGIAELAIDTVLDVGAHHGEFGRYLRRTIGYTGRIVSFEPIGSNFTILEKIAAADGNWEVHPFGLGPRTEERGINVMHATDYSSLLSARAENKQFASALAVDRVETIKLVPLDEIGPSLAPPSSRVFLKTDTQGFDLEVMRGATQFLRRVSMVQMELAFKPLYQGVPLYDQVVAYMREQGFAMLGFFPLSRDKNLAVIEFDGVMVNEHLHRTTLAGS
jgi:FkbM family methyltransferase